MTIKQATTTAEKLKVYRLRYKVYVEDFDKKYIKGIQEDYQLVADEFDEKGYSLYVVDSEGLFIGTLRISFFNNGDRNNFDPSFSIPSSIQRYVVVDRFAVIKDKRSTNIAMILAKSIYEKALHQGVYLCLIESPPPLMKLYEKMGFVQFQTITKYGGLKRHLLFLNLLDKGHLTTIKSPFLPLLEQYVLDISNPFLKRSSIRESSFSASCETKNKTCKREDSTIEINQNKKSSI